MNHCSFHSPQSHQGIGGLQAIPPAPPLRGGAGWELPECDNWQNCRSLDESIAPVRSFYGPSGLVSACCDSNAVCAIIASAVAAYREFVLLRLALSLTASLSYLPPAFNHFEDRLGKHDVAVSPKLSGLIIIPTGALVLSFAAFEDIAHTVKQWAVERYARHPAAESFPNSHEGKTGGCGQRVWRQTRD